MKTVFEHHSSPSSGWRKRPLSNPGNGTLTRAGTLPIPPPSSRASSLSTISVSSNDVTSSGLASRQLSKKLRFLVLLLVGALLITLGNSFFITLQLMTTMESQHQPANPLGSNKNQEISKNLKDDDVSHHDAEEERPPLTRNPQQQQAILISPEDLFRVTERQAKLVIAQNLSLVRDGQNISSRIRSCRFEDCQTLQEKDTNSRLVYYNNFPDRPRYTCGLRIEAGSVSVLNIKTISPCHQQQQPPRATLFPVLPTLANQQNSSLLPPIQLGIKGVKPSRSTRFSRFRNCDVKCSFLHNNLNSQAIARTIVGTPWEIASSMEGPEYYQSLIQQQGRRSNINQYFSTTSLDSDIPLPYFSWDDYAPQGRADVPGLDYDKAIKGAVFMARNCQSKNQREALVKDLIHLSNASNFRVDSVSRCLHNHDPTPTNVKDKNEILGKYLFYLAFENQNSKDYITEKLWGSLFRSGTLPVYLGSANVAEHVPPHSIINVRDFQDAKALWSYLLKVANNRTLYESYHLWRKQPLPQSFVQKYNFTHTHSTCRLARWAFAKLYGWGWDHASQTVQEASVRDKRKLCWMNYDGVLTHPFRERWFSHTFRELEVQKEHDTLGQSPGMDYHSTCYNPGDQPEDQTGSIRVGSIRRTVWGHDGIVDIFLEPINKVMVGRTLILEMSVPFLVESRGKISWKRVSHHEFWLQKDSYRITILTSQVVVLTSPREGVLQIFISIPDCANKHPGACQTRLRVLIEHVDASRPSGQEKSFFGKVVANDFFQPLEKFLVLSDASSATGDPGA